MVVFLKYSWYGIKAQFGLVFFEFFLLVFVFEFFVFGEFFSPFDRNFILFSVIFDEKNLF